MSNVSESGPRASIPPLTACGADGKPYRRSERVHAEIATMLRLPQSEWLAKAGSLQNESLVFFIRQARWSDEELYGWLLQQLIRRIIGLARQRVAGLDRLAYEEIPLTVEVQILDLVLADEPSRKSDFLRLRSPRRSKSEH